MESLNWSSLIGIFKLLKSLRYWNFNTAQVLLESLKCPSLIGILKLPKYYWNFKTAQVLLELTTREMGVSGRWKFSLHFRFDFHHFKHRNRNGGIKLFGINQTYITKLLVTWEPPFLRVPNFRLAFSAKAIPNNVFLCTVLSVLAIRKDEQESSQRLPSSMDLKELEWKQKYCAFCTIPWPLPRW